MTQDEITQQKEIEFYAASVNAWYGSSLEHDKSIFALSAGGVGLLVSLMTTVGVTSIFVLLLHAVAIVFFLFCLAFLLYIFRRNQRHIEQVLNVQDPINDPGLQRVDLLVLITFWLGVFFSASVGVASGFKIYEKEQQAMSEKKQVVQPIGNKSMAQDSFSGITNLQKSFNGVGRIAPNAGSTAGATQRPTPAPAPAPTPAPESSSNNSGGSGS